MMRAALFYSLQILVLVLQAVHGAVMVEPARPIKELIRTKPENLHVLLVPLKEKYTAFRRINDEIEAAVAFAYFENAVGFHPPMKAGLVEVLKLALVMGLEKDEGCRNAAQYYCKNLWRSGGEYISWLRNEWNEGHKVSTFIQGLTTASQKWLESLTDELKETRAKCQGRLRDRSLERTIVSLSDMLQVTIELFELREKKGSLRRFRFDPLTGSSVMTIHLLLSGNRAAPTIDILTPEARRHYGALAGYELVSGRQNNTSKADDTQSTESKEAATKERPSRTTRKRRRSELSSSEEDTDDEHGNRKHMVSSKRFKRPSRTSADPTKERLSKSENSPTPWKRSPSRKSSRHHSEGEEESNTHSSLESEESVRDDSGEEPKEERRHKSSGKEKSKRKATEGGRDKKRASSKGSKRSKRRRTSEKTTK